MKKHLFLLGSFMTSSLVAANTLLVISCKKKASVKEKNENEKDTTEQVEFGIATKVKAEIKNIIDDVITKPIDESIDWIIKLDDDSLNRQQVIDFINGKVEEIKDNSGQDGQVALESSSELISTLIDKIKEKFASLKDVIIRRINNKEEELGISNFNFDFDSASIAPMLTALNGI